MAALIGLIAIVNSECPEDCLGKMCEDPCYNECGISCDYFCNEDCEYWMVGDGICHSSCNNHECLFDLNDCRRRTLITSYTLTNTSQIEETTTVQEKNYGKIAGVGLGVFLVIMAIILGVLLCIIGTATPVFFVFLLLGILIPLITFLIVALAPLHKTQKEQKDTRSDSFVTSRIIFLITMIVFAILAIVKLFEYHVGINLKAKGVNSNISKISSEDLLNTENPNPQMEQNPLIDPVAAEAQRNPLAPASHPLAPQGSGNLNPLSRNPFLSK